MSDARHHGQDALESVRALFSAAHRMDPVGVRAGLAFSLGGSVLRPLYPLLFKILVDAALGGRTETAIWAGFAIGVVSAVGGAAGGYASMYLWNVWERMSIVIDEQLVGLTTRLGLLSQMEDPELADHMTLILTNRQGFQESMMSLLFSANLLVQVAITVVILVSVAPVLLLLPLFAIAPVVATRWAERRTQEVMKATSPITRTANGFVMLGIDPQAAGELRVLRVRELILERQRRAWDEVIRMQWRAETAGAIVTTLALLVFTIGFGGSILLVTARSIRGAATLGSVILVLTAGQQLHAQVGGVLNASGDLFRIRELIEHYRWIVRYVERHEDVGDASPNSGLAEGIIFENVSFRYESGPADALHDVSLFLPAGAVVAIVGENGAGKTTLVKLLCGLLRPTSGRILVDGMDVANLDSTAWRTSMTGAFQDFMRFEFLARESVGVGRIERVGDTATIRQALRRADVAELESTLPNGLETPLGRAYLEGIDLSGGEWQKVALARAMMRDAPLVLVLDEPTYSLDVESERRVFEWFSRVARSETNERMITVIVSHRFSTVRTANLIMVMREGRLVESGTHPQLLALEGTYAAMYRTQAQGYR